MGFTLDQLTERYLKILSPVAYSPRYQRTVPITDMFQDLIEFISDDTNPRKKEYRDKLLGKNVIDFAPGRYWQLQMIVSMEGLLASWDTLPIHQKAELRAYYQLNNMSELLRQHAQNMEDNRRSALQKAEAANKKK